MVVILLISFLTDAFHIVAQCIAHKSRIYVTQRSPHFLSVWISFLVLCAAFQPACCEAFRLEGGQLEVYEGLEVVWESPQNPIAMLVLFHRAGRSARSWWDKSKLCESCMGMPEEKAIAGSSVARGFATAAVSCRDSRTKRWDQRDGQLVAHALVALTSARNWRSLPFFSLGVGCGAGFAATVLPSALPPSMPVRGVYLQLMSDQAGLKPSVMAKAFKGGHGVIGAGLFGRANNMLANPPARLVAIMHMPRDETVARAARAIRVAWEQAGATVLEHRVLPKPLHDAYFSEAIAEITTTESAALVDMLRQAGYLSSGGFLVADPQRSAWRSVVSAPLGLVGGYELGTLRAVQRDSMSPFDSPIAEEINRAYALSETSAQFMNQTLDFFFSNSRKILKRRSRYAASTA